MEVANHEQYEAWNGESGERWVASADRRDRVLGPVADVLLAAAGSMSGHAVLDLGCGCGATTLAAARAVGASGQATGIDLSGPMLDVARHRAVEAGVANVTFVQGDLQAQGELPRINRVISRFGTMFFSDPGAAFANVRRVLADDGKMVLATWQPLAANEWLTAPGAALLPFAELPESEPTAPGMFSQADPDVVRTMLNSAGFTSVELDAVTVPLTLGRTVDEAVEHLVDSGPGRVVLAAVPDDQRDDALDAVGTVLRERETDAGIQLDGAVWIVRAR